MYLFLLPPLAAILTYGGWRLLGKTKLHPAARLALALILGTAVSALLLWCVLVGAILLWQWNDPIQM